MISVRARGRVSGRDAPHGGRFESVPGRFPEPGAAPSVLGSPSTAGARRTAGAAALTAHAPHLAPQNRPCRSCSLSGVAQARGCWVHGDLVLATLLRGRGRCAPSARHLFDFPGYYDRLKSIVRPRSRHAFVSGPGKHFNNPPHETQHFGRVIFLRILDLEPPFFDCAQGFLKIWRREFMCRIVVVVQSPPPSWKAYALLAGK